MQTPSSDAANTQVSKTRKRDMHALYAEDEVLDVSIANLFGYPEHLQRNWQHARDRMLEGPPPSDRSTEGLNEWREAIYKYHEDIASKLNTHIHKTYKRRSGFYWMLQYHNQTRLRAVEYYLLYAFHYYREGDDITSKNQSEALRLRKIALDKQKELKLKLCKFADFC